MKKIIKQKLNKIITVTVCTVMAAVGLCGCKPEQSQLFTYPGTEVRVIEIETGANNVLLERSSGSDIEVSYPQEVAKIQDGKLQISIPMPKAGLNLRNPAEVIIRIPEHNYETIRIKSEAGSIQINQAAADCLAAETQYGDITLSGVTGHITAKAEIGAIQKSAPMDGEVKSIGRAGQELEANTDALDREINLYTNAGNIELK